MTDTAGGGGNLKYALVEETPGGSIGEMSGKVVAGADGKKLEDGKMNYG